MEKYWFEEYMEKRRSYLKSRVSNASSDMYVDTANGIAVIGIQSSFSGCGKDTIHVFIVGDWKERQVFEDQVMQGKYKSGRLWPTGVFMKEGVPHFSYREKFDSGGFWESEMPFESGSRYSFKEIMNKRRLV